MADTVATNIDLGSGPILAVCGFEMRHGVHCAAFTIRALPYANVGVVGADFDPSEPGTNQSTNFVMATKSGEMFCNSRTDTSGSSNWAGQTAVEAGDVVVSHSSVSACCHQLLQVSVRHSLLVLL